jgi:hypothetical protein
MAVAWRESKRRINMQNGKALVDGHGVKRAIERMRNEQIL